ncbi:MAG: ABC transporter substrate-binding protein [Sulfobacillus acidophilus]|uniref:ABC transporter substrate-binding protein n=1 Tax=Sulfobacillus acidophilus TaxID=53633 RepID=A0A2T2WDY0_9FIRM|nr:MAG: ABC transporter substrate-binding protein [Sulfobacillus acidophilus]
MRHRWWPWLLLLLALVPALLIAKPRQQLSSTPPAENVSEAIFSNPNTLDPALANTASDWAVDSNVFQPLFRVTSTGRVVGELVSRYSIRGHELTLVIKPALLTHGEDLTAKIVAEALARPLWSQVGSAAAAHLLSPVVGVRAVLSGSARYLSGVVVVNRDTVRIRLRHRVGPGFLKTLANPVLSIVPPQDQERGGADWQLIDLDGTGGYRLQNWTPNGSLTFTRTSGRGPLEIVLDIYSSFKQAVLSFENQTVSVVPVNPSRIALVPLRLVHEVRALPQPGDLYLVWRKGAVHASTYPTVSVSRWVSTSFRGRIPALHGRWPSTIASDRRMIIYVNQDLPEALQLAQTLARLKPNRVTVRAVPLSRLKTMAQNNQISAYIGQADLFKSGTAMALAPMRSLWLVNPAIHEMRVFANGALAWHSLTSKP